MIAARFRTLTKYGLFVWVYNDELGTDEKRIGPVADALAALIEAAEVPIYIAREDGWCCRLCEKRQPRDGYGPLYDPSTDHHEDCPLAGVAAALPEADR